MSTPEKILFTWSGGKDSAQALYELQRSPDYDIAALLTTVTEDYDRISMHGVRSILLEQQAKSIGLTLEKVFITKNSSNEEYEARMNKILLHYRGLGVSTVAFGDIFLQDLKKYREENLLRVGLKALFPVWKRDTHDLARSFIDLGFRAVVTCIDSKVLNQSFVGREFNSDFLTELPETVDPCGENGEFHTFVYDGPIFKNKIPFEIGDVVLRDDRFYYCDLKPSNGPATCSRIL